MEIRKCTYFGTITNKVVRYSESKMKCSFFTNSARFLVNKLPLENIIKSFEYNELYKIFYSIGCRLKFVGNLLEVSN